MFLQPTGRATRKIDDVLVEPMQMRKLILAAVWATGSTTALAQSSLTPSQLSLLNGALQRTGDTMTGPLNIANPVFSGPISFTVTRTVTSGNTGNPAAFVGDDNETSGYSPEYGSLYGNVPGFQVNRTNGTSANGSVSGVQVNLMSKGENPYASEDLGYDSHVYKSGQNSTWQFNGETDDSTGLPPASFAVMGQELDIVANGPDAAASMYDPQQANRRFAYYAAREYPTKSWAASTSVSAGTLVKANNPSGVASVYIATTAGTSGSTQPAWPAGGTVTDGGVTWTYGEPYALTVGTAIWLDNGEDSNTSYNTGLATNGVFNNAVIDLSKATLNGTNPAAMRVAANQAIDLSANYTAAGKNQHFLEYSTFGAQNALVYNNPTGTVFSISDTGNWSRFFGPTSLAVGYNCHGMTTGFPTTGVTYCWNMTNGGAETDAVVGQGGLNIYPATSSGSISAAPAFALTSAGSGSFSGSVAVAANLTVAGTATVSGSRNVPVSDKTTTFTFDATVENVTIDATNGNVIGQLPACVAAVRGRHYALKKLDSSTHTVSFRTTGSDLIDGATVATIVTRYGVATATCSATAGRWDEGF